MGIPMAGGHLSVVENLMNTENHFDVLIIGGGPAGSAAALPLVRDGMRVAVIEKKIFPREVLCGEFLSHEVLSFLNEFGVYGEFLSLSPHPITHFRLIPDHGVEVLQPLGFNAFALKRSLLDQLLLHKAHSSGAVIFQPAEVLTIQREADRFIVECKTIGHEQVLSASDIICAYGKQNILDKRLKRNFASMKSGFTGIKYHIPSAALNSVPLHEIQIFTSRGIYCGINSVNSTETTLCFLFDSVLFQNEPRDALESLVQYNKSFRLLFRENPLPTLQHLPVYGTGNIYFGKRNIVESGMYMAGDAAAVIAPLAGDGIGMALESGMLAANTLLKAKRKGLSKSATALLYKNDWDALFKKRLAIAHRLQKIAMQSLGLQFGMTLLRLFPALTGKFIRWTRNRMIPKNP
jgi:menaquinone-9 beta-reductase